jgi:hypothetical protein
MLPALGRAKSYQQMPLRIVNNTSHIDDGLMQFPLAVFLVPA